MVDDLGQFPSLDPKTGKLRPQHVPTDKTLDAAVKKVEEEAGLDEAAVWARTETPPAWWIAAVKATGKTPLSLDDLRRTTDKHTADFLEMDGSLSREQVIAIITPVLEAFPDVTDAAAASAATAVANQLLDAGVVTGASQANVDDVAWQMTTDPDPVTGAVKALPIGFTSKGRLAAFGVRRFLEDLLSSVEIATDPIWSFVKRAPNGKIIWGEKWDGQVVIPGLVGSGKSSDLTGTYVDAPYSHGAVWLPTRAASRGAIWGSSSARGFTDALTALWGSRGFYGGGRGSERSCHILARMNARRAIISFPSNTIPASGSVSVTVPNFERYYGSNPGQFGGTVAGVAGNLIYDGDGTFSWGRSAPGTEVSLSGPTPMESAAGVAQRDSTVILNIGKNDVTQTLVSGRETSAVVRERTRQAFDYLAPLQKRVLVMTHFVDTNVASLPAGTQARTGQINADIHSDYGSLVLDLNSWILSPAAWTQTGISPTAADLTAQAEGRKPPSLSLDDAHLNTAAYDAFTNNVIAPKIASLNWFGA